MLRAVLLRQTRALADCPLGDCPVGFPLWFSFSEVVEGGAEGGEGVGGCLAAGDVLFGAFVLGRMLLE